jgi:hypothetical protein
MPKAGASLKGRLSSGVGSLRVLKSVLAAFELSTERSPDVALRRQPNAAGGAFDLPCCWAALAVNAAADHCCEVRPTIPLGEPPPGAPAAAGHLRSCTGIRVPISAPPSRKACPHAVIGTHPSIRISKFQCGFLRPETWRGPLFSIAVAPLRSRCELKATPGRNHRIWRAWN